MTLPFQINPPLPHVREYCDADAESVSRMWRESASAWPGGGPSGGEDSTPSRVRQEQRDLSTLATYIAFLPHPSTGEERAVGYCSLFEYTGQADTAYVGTLSAHPAWHGKGVGRDLLRAALQRTVEMGYTRLDLNTWAGNLKAVPLYKKSGYFWVPDTTVKMENYLPLIFRLPAAQQFFQRADWYADLKRELDVKPDEEKHGHTEVYTYRWEKDGQLLQVVIDRRARGVAALETERFAVSIEIDDPRLPIGGTRNVRWRLRNTGRRPAQVSVLAEGEDAVRCTFQSSQVVENTAEWSAPVTAEQPRTKPASNRPSNRVRSTVVVDGDPVQLVSGTQLVQPISLEFETGRRFLVPGVRQDMWLTLDNPFEEPVSGTLHLSATPGLRIDRGTIEFAIEPRSRTSERITLEAAQSGTETLRAHAQVDRAEGDALRTKVYDLDLFCGEPGEIYIEQDDERVRIHSDRIALSAPLKPSGDWMVRFSVVERESGTSILSHATSLGPPFVPSVFTNSTWTPRIEHRGSAVLLVLSTSPDAYPGLTFERHILFSPSGLIRVSYRATNAGGVSRMLEVSAGTSVNLGLPRRTEIAVPLATGLVVEDSSRFPDWNESDVSQPSRYAESWMAEFGEGWCGATIWREVKEIQADWMTPDLVLDLGTVEPGARVETAPVYVYAGQGDWKTARALWRQLVAPDGSRDSVAPRPAHSARIERFTFASAEASAKVVLTSERSRGLSGSVQLETGVTAVTSGEVTDLRLGNPSTLEVRVTLPEVAQAVPALVVLDHERSTDRYETPLFRVGNTQEPVTVGIEGSGDTQRVTLDNGRLRIGIVPAEMARVAELSVRCPDGVWQNQLYAPDTTPGIFVWFNPWYGGIHPTLDVDKWYPGRLTKERWTWSSTTRTGQHGIEWQGITVSTLTTGADFTGVRQVAGLRVEISYLTCGESNLLAVAFRITNEGTARVEGGFSLHSFLQPGGDRTTALLHRERVGEVRVQKRAHGGQGGSSDAWCAVSGPEGTPAIAIVPGSQHVRVGDVRDMGLEGAHPSISRRLRLAPGETVEDVAYYVVAENVEQARLYRHLRNAEGLV